MGKAVSFKELFSNRSTPVMFLAPIEPITANPIIREVCARQGAEIVCRPKILPQHLLKARKWQFYQKIKAGKKVRTFTDRPIFDGIQLIAKLEDPLGPAIKFVNQNAARLGVSYIDLNFGCPGYKVRPQKRGGELLQNPEIILQVIERCLKFAEIPISIKIRKGYSNQDTPYNLLEQINREFGTNIAWISLNRAPVKMGDVINSEILSDFEVFQEARRAVEFQIPIIANGGIRNPSDIQKMARKTQCEGIMIGRAALGNQSLFSSTIRGKDTDYGNFTSQLNEFFSVVQKYARGNTGRWCTIGEMKRLTYYYIKSYYNTKHKQILPGYGFSKWNTAHFSPKEFELKLVKAFPDIPESKFKHWLSFLH